MLRQQFRPRKAKSWRQSLSGPLARLLLFHQTSVVRKEGSDHSKHAPPIISELVVTRHRRTNVRDLPDTQNDTSTRPCRCLPGVNIHRRAFLFTILHELRQFIIE